MSFAHSQVEDEEDQLHPDCVEQATLLVYDEHAVNILFEPIRGYLLNNMMIA